MEVTDNCCILVFKSLILKSNHTKAVSIAKSELPNFQIL